MRVAQVLLPEAGVYESRCHTADRELRDGITVDSIAIGHGEAGAITIVEAILRLRSSRPDLIHIYANDVVPARMVAGSGCPWVSNRDVVVAKTLFRRTPAATRFLGIDVPEAVGDAYFDIRREERTRPPHRIGTFVRSDAVRNNAEQAMARIQRFRDDIAWELFTEPPEPRVFAALDLWVDPAADELDYDGLVCEALAASIPVVAAKTTINRARTDDGLAAFLAPLHNPNELVHAILAALFKPELYEPRREVARVWRETFRTENRLARLAEAYAEVVP